MNIRKLGAAALATGLALGGLTACGSSDKGSGSDLKIGIKFDQPGLGLKQGTEYKGFDVDVAKYVAKKLGTDEKDVKWVQAPSAQRETLLETGQVDMVVATYTINDSRKQKVDFAGPYFMAHQDLLVRSDDTSITGVEALDGKKLCSVKGSTSAQNVQKKVPGVNLQEFSTYSECVAALNAKQIDALTTDDTILAGYAAQEQYKGKLKVVGNPFTDEPYGIGLKKGDTEKCTKVTEAVKAMFDDGSWQKAVDANFGAADFKPGKGNPPTPAACS